MDDQFMHEDQVKTTTTYPILFKRLWPYARKEKLLLFLAVAAVLVTALISRLIPTVVGYAIDHGVGKKNIALFQQMTFLYLALEITKTALSFGNMYVFQKFGNRMLFHLREHLLKHTQSLPLQFFNKTPTGRIVTRLTNDANSLGELFSDGVIAVFIQFIMLVSVVVALVLISWKLALAAMALAPIFIYASFYLSEKVRAILRDQKRILSSMNSFLSENFNGIKVVQLYNRGAKNTGLFFNQSEEYRKITLASVYAYALMQPVMNLFSAVTLTTALYYGGILTTDNALPIGALVAFIMNIQDFIPPLREILEKYQQFQNSITSAERIFTLMDEPIEVSEGTVAIAGKSIDSASVPTNSEKEAFKLTGDIEFKNLNFRYEPQLPLVLKNINLKIEAGKSVAFIGRTGSGKSTMISLLQRFYECPKQSVFIDNVAIEDFDLQDLRRHIGVVQQDVFIFRGTIAENVSLKDKSVSQEAIQKACEKIGYLELLQRSGRTLESFVEERGANLSAGERQLLAFARILAFNPDILILDEATSNIDSATEKLIQKATEEVSAGRTSIIIAHRLSTVEKCDQIVVLSQGEIVEAGSPRELYQLKGAYYQLAVAGLNSTLIAESAEGTAVP